MIHLPECDFFTKFFISRRRFCFIFQCYFCSGVKIFNDFMTRQAGVSVKKDSVQSSQPSQGNPNDNIIFLTKTQATDEKEKKKIFLRFSFSLGRWRLKIDSVFHFLFHVTLRLHLIPSFFPLIKIWNIFCVFFIRIETFFQLEFS